MGNYYNETFDKTYDSIGNGKIIKRNLYLSELNILSKFQNTVIATTTNDLAEITYFPLGAQK